MIILTIELEQQQIPLNSKLCCFIINNIGPQIIDIDVINGYHHNGGEGELDDSLVGHVLTVAPLSAYHMYIMNRKLQSPSQFQSVIIILKIHILPQAWFWVL